jgi:predicted ABC-type ATPase
MKDLEEAVRRIKAAQERSKKPLAIVLAGHNGAGKSTMWYARLADELRIPLINADRMMMSILPDAEPLPAWAQDLRDRDLGWMQVAQRGVQAFVAQAMERAVPFAMETVFSHWRRLPSGKYESKIDNIKDMQKAGYFVLLLFVGLASAELSMARVNTRVERGGHAVDPDKLIARFPRTQAAISAALDVADAAILVDNSRDIEEAFTIAHVRQAGKVQFDCRDLPAPAPKEILAWLERVAPRT